ncbi:hypothetical protein BT93_L4787 [Corymbia citriodora subsp. variegata]|uniref:Uncharacterized protein n=1 Tax=Corymbia citriodora subsp. variegata TaxID=360336 RepID=A0A8T0CJS4_CORYI|nr:hypothetical protein BT93_L4787 [Corymbia citriodora subsp. variegata]
MLYDSIDWFDRDNNYMSFLKATVSIATTMRLQTFVRCAGALLALATTIEANKETHHRHSHLHRRHQHAQIEEPSQNATKEYDGHELKKRGTCAFPTNAGLVAVTPGSSNGQVSMQWDPSAVSYTYPLSMVSSRMTMNGGLFCGLDGSVSKPFPDKPYCQATATNINAVNNAGSTVAFCQTVLPGNEAMLIPTQVDSTATLAIPDTSYWAGTAAHYYINPPGVSTSQGCVWGSNANPWGNWSPYVAGGNSDASGNTYLKIGWNPIYLETTTPFRNQMPNWGVKIECPNGGCNGLPCAIDPSQNSVNTMQGSSSNGAGGGAFCVVTVNQGSTANIVITGSGSSSSSSSSSNSNSNHAAQGGNVAAGQFYTSSASSVAPTPTTTSSTSSTSRSTTTSTTSTTSASSWHNWSGNSTSVLVSTTWSSAQTSSTTAKFNATSARYAISSNATAAATSMIAPSILPATGDASRYGMSAVGLAIAIWTLV